MQNKTKQKKKKKNAESVSSTLWNKGLQFSLSKHNSLNSLDCLPYAHYVNIKSFGWNSSSISSDLSQLLWPFFE